MTLGDGATMHLRASGSAPDLHGDVEAAVHAAAERLLQDNLAFAAAQTGSA